MLKFQSQEKFAQWLGGVTRGAVGNWEQGKEVGIENLKAMATKAGVSLDWLAYNAGPKPGSNPSRRIITTFDPDALDSDATDDGHAYSREHWAPKVKGALPEIDVKLGAGNGQVGEVINLKVGNGQISGHRVLAEWLFSEDFIRHEAKASVSQTVVMEVVGDSMLPTYMPGDRVMVDMSQVRMSVDTVYAISDGASEPQIKRLQRVPFSDPVQVRIISDNASFQTDVVELARLTIIGRVCGHIARK